MVVRRIDGVDPLGLLFQQPARPVDLAGCRTLLDVHVRLPASEQRDLAACVFEDLAIGPEGIITFSLRRGKIAA